MNLIKIGESKIVYTNKEMNLYIKKFKYITYKYTKFINYILKNSQNPSLAITVFVVEQMNRGHIVLKFIELLLTFIFPKLIILFDWSIGPFQMKPSFYGKYTNSESTVFEINDFIKSLECFEIFITEHKHLSDEEKIALYHSGNINDSSLSTKKYIYLYRWFNQNFIT